MSAVPPIRMQSDEQVIERILAGDGQLFEVLMRRHNQRIYRTVRSVLRDEAEVEDAMQGAYLHAYAHLKEFRGLTPIGRYGAFKYNNQDHSILMGVLAAENLLEGKTHDLWGVNTDYDSYQESGSITEAGLELRAGS